jgi:adenylyltransferase/sulfurtransferase
MSDELKLDAFPTLSWFRREQVEKARVTVVGCGALGNEVLKNLALFGFRHLVVVDFDRVESSNLSRSVFFTTEDARLKRKKVDVVAERLKAMNPGIDVQGIFGDIAYEVGLGLIRSMDVVIGCVDNRWARYCINRLCMRAGIPWVDGGIDGLEGTARVFMPGKNCYACNLGPEGLRHLALRMSCAGIVRRNEEAGRAATTPIVASVIGAVEVQEALKLIHREQLANGELTSLCGRMFCYEGQHLTTRIVNFEAYDDDCPVHQHWEPVVMSDIAADLTVKNCLQRLKSLLDDDQLQICLNDSFVDYVESRAENIRMSVMEPGRAVADFIEQNTPWKGYMQGSLYQHEYRVIDESFPYQELTLAQIGIPVWDILKVETRKGEKFVEMRQE